MPAFSATSRQRLSTCHQDLQVLFDEVVRQDDCTIICGYRGERDQRTAYLAGRSTLNWPDSKHNVSPSMAVDAAPYTPEIGNIDWDDIKAMCVFAGKVEMVARRLLSDGRMSHRLRWGGDWDGDGRTVDQKFNDLPHFELIPVDRTDGDR